MTYAQIMKRSIALAAICAALAACSGAMVPPEAIGDVEGPVMDPMVESRVAPGNMDIAANSMPAYSGPQQSVQATDQSVDYLNTPNLAGSSASQAQETASDTIYSDENADGGNQDGFLDRGVNMDAAMGLSSASPEPLWTDPAVSVQSAPAVNEQKVAFIPRFTTPDQVPESYGGMPASEKSCRRELKRLGVVYQDMDRISDGAHCGIAYPVKVSGLAGGIEIKSPAKLNCQMAVTFAKWVKKELVPSARARYFSGVKTIRQMSSYSCRRMNSSSSNPWSEHAKGNAIDIGSITLNNGKFIDVSKKGFFAFREKGLLKAVRADSCKYFSTVLGPGSDRHHKDHFHFDLRTRKSGRSYCSL